MTHGIYLYCKHNLIQIHFWAHFCLPYLLYFSFVGYCAKGDVAKVDELLGQYGARIINSRDKVLIYLHFCVVDTCVVNKSDIYF